MMWLQDVEELLADIDKALDTYREDLRESFRLKSTVKERGEHVAECLDNLIAELLCIAEDLPKATYV